MKAALVFLAGRERSQVHLFRTGQNLHVYEQELVRVAVSYCPGLDSVHQKLTSIQNLCMGSYSEIGSLKMQSRYDEVILDENGS